MVKKTYYANYGDHEIPFNDSLGDLDYFRIVEDKWSLAFEKNDLKELYNSTMLYYIALKTRSKFDGEKIYLYFDTNGDLVKSEYIEGKNGESEQETAAEDERQEL